MNIIFKKIKYFLFLFILLSFQKVNAATFTIDDPTGDDIDNGLCSITEAVRNFEHGGTNGSVDCTAGAFDTDNTFEITTNIVLDAVDSTHGTIPYGIHPLSSGNVVINGNNHSISRDSGAPEFRIFGLSGLYNFTINDLTISGADTNSVNNSEGAGMSIASAISFTLNNVVFNDNHSDIGGGLAIRNESSPNTEVTIVDSTFTNNSANDAGGALYLLGTNTMNVSMDNVVFDGNLVNIDNSYGAAIRARLVDSITVDNSSFSNNTISDVSSHADGGVFALTDSHLTITDSTFTTNGFYATILRGGVIFSEVDTDTASVEISRSTFESNSAGSGGVIYLLNGVDLEIVNSTFLDNDGLDDGGVIFSMQTEGGTPNNIDVSYVTAYDSYSGQTAGAFFYNCIDNGGCDGTPSGSTDYVFENSLIDGCDGDLSGAQFTNIFKYGNVDTCGTSGVVTNSSTVLEDLGGEVEVLPLSSGSNAIDSGVAGTLGCPSVDARGRPRPFSSGCDVGSFEFDSDGITVTETGGSTQVSEDGSTDTFSVFLESYPLSTVNISFSNDGNLSFSPSSISFNPSDWPQTVTVTVSAVDDNNDEEDSYSSSVGFGVSSVDVGYNNFLLSDIVVSVLDNDNFSASGSSPGPSVNQNPEPTPEPEPVPEIPITPEPTPEPDTVPPPPPEIPVTPEPEPAPEPVTPEIEEPSPENENIDNTKDGDGKNLSLENITNKIKEEIEIIRLGIDEKVPYDTTVTVSVVGITLPAVAVAISQPAVVTNILSIPIRLWNLIPIWLGLRRRKRPWGTVYDSITKQPLDPVYVSLLDSKNKEVFNTITDIDGRFGFLVQPGKYKILVKKDDYTFPSSKYVNKDSDSVYGNVYMGSEVEINGEDDLVIKNIPMDSERFNWNEFEKTTNKKLMKFYSKRDIFFSNIATVAFWSGAVSSIVLLIINTTKINYILFGVYVFIFILKIFGLKPKKPGYVFDKETGFPLSYGLVKVFSTSLQKEIAHTVIGKTGKYYVLVPNGEYYLTISKKTGEDSYEEVFRSESMNIKKGFIGRNFNI